jgi:DNA-binding transcriptional ArsR family regulator
MLNESTPPGLPDSRLGTEPTQPQLQSAAATFALLGSAPRLHLAWLMAHETSDVGTLARRVGLSIPTTSQHLAKLRLAGIVSARREGRHTYYTVEDPHVLTMLDQIFGHIAPDGTLAPDPPAGDLGCPRSHGSFLNAAGDRPGRPRSPARRGRPSRPAR